MRMRELLDEELSMVAGGEEGGGDVDNHDVAGPDSETPASNTEMGQNLLDFTEQSADFVQGGGLNGSGEITGGGEDGNY